MANVGTPVTDDVPTPTASVEDAFQTLRMLPSYVEDMAAAATDTHEVPAMPTNIAYNDAALRRAMDMSLADWNTIFVHRTGQFGAAFKRAWDAYMASPAAKKKEAKKKTHARAQKTIINFISEYAADDFGRTIEPIEERGDWSPLKWDAWIVHEMCEILWTPTQGPLRLSGRQKADALTLCCLLRCNQLYRHSRRQRPKRQTARSDPETSSPTRPQNPTDPLTDDETTAAVPMTPASKSSHVAGDPDAVDTDQDNTDRDDIDTDQDGMDATGTDHDMDSDTTDLDSDTGSQPGQAEATPSRYKLTDAEKAEKRWNLMAKKGAARLIHSPRKVRRHGTRATPEHDLDSLPPGGTDTTGSDIAMGDAPEDGAHLARGTRRADVDADVLTVRDVAHLASSCELGPGATQRECNDCMCRYHCWERVYRVCAGKMGLERLGKSIKALNRGAAEPFDTAKPILELDATIEEARDTARKQATVDALMSGDSVSREDFAEHCRMFRLTSDDKLKVAGTDIRLNWWQVSGAALILQARAAGQSGIVLGDDVGLGKTFTLALVLLWAGKEAAKRWQAAVDAGEDATALEPRPMLLAVPPTLIEQTKAELHRFSKALRVKVYYGDLRNSDLDEGDYHLHPRHPWLRFDRKHPATVTVILTGHETFRNRHGPKALARHRGVPSPPEEQLIDPPRPDEWERDLGGCFDIVCVDEAHVARSASSHVAQSLKWLAPRFVLLVTATPMWSHTNDMAGMIKLVESRGASDRARQELGTTHDPWTYSEESELGQLRYSAYAYEQFATIGQLWGPMTEQAKRVGATASKDEVATAAATRLRDLRTRFVIRRDQSTQFAGGPRIGEQLPRRLAYNLLVSYEEDGQRLYNTATEEFRKRLYTAEADQDGGKPRLKMNAFIVRQLMTACDNPAWLYSELLAKPGSDLKVSAATKPRAPLC